MYNNKNNNSSTTTTNNNNDDDNDNNNNNIDLYLYKHILYWKTGCKQLHCPITAHVI